MGKRVNLAALASEPVLDAPLPRFTEPLQPPVAALPTTVPLHQVASNPINPREDFGDLSDLESMRTVGQIQPCAVVTRSAFLSVYPEHEGAIVDAIYIVVAGSRRREAADRFGLQTLSVTVLDHLAVSRAQFYAASVAENIDRKNFDVLEEARAVQRLVQESGSGTETAEILGKTKGWVSQRLALLKLSSEMQALLRVGELPIRDARRLAAQPIEEQLATWKREQEQAEQAAHDRFTAVNHSPDRRTRTDHADGDSTAATNRTPPRTGRISFSPEATTHEIATLLRSHLSPDDLASLVEALIGLPR